MIIYESNFTTSKLSIVFWGSLGSSEIGSSLKPNNQKEI